MKKLCEKIIMLRKPFSFLLIICTMVSNANVIFAGAINQKYLVDLNTLPQCVAEELNSAVAEIKNRDYCYKVDANNSFFADGGGMLLSGCKLYNLIVNCYKSKNYSNIFTSNGIEDYDRSFGIYYSAIMNYDEWLTLKGLNGISINKLCLGDYGVVLKSDGTVSAWGDNDCGQLGNGTNVSSDVASNVIGLTNIIDISGANGTSLAVKTDGTVYGWGSNYSGILGSKVGEYSNIPVKLEGLDNVKRVEVGDGIGVALKYDGTVWVFGNSNIYGNDNITYSPIQIWGFNNIADISCKSRHIAAVDKYGNVYTWGENEYGQLGNGTNTISDFAYKVNNISDVKKVIAGNNNTLALKNDGTLYGWGGNNFGELGNGTRIDQYLPVQVNLDEKIYDISMDSFIGKYSYALTESGSIYFWGASDGDPTSNDVFTLPTKITDNIYVIDKDMYEESVNRKMINLKINNNIINGVDLYPDDNNFDYSYISVNKLFEYFGYSVTDNDGSVIISNSNNKIINDRGTSVFEINGKKTILQTPHSFGIAWAGREDADSNCYYLPIGAIKYLFNTSDITWDKYNNTIVININ